MKKVTYKKVFNVLDDTLLLINKTSMNSSEDVDFIVGISRGGLLPAMYISTTLVKPLVAAYINKKDEVFFDRDEWVKDKHVLLVDDIVRSGKTLSKIKGLLYSKGVKRVSTLTIYSLMDSEIQPDFSKIIKEDIKFPWDHDE